MQDSRRVRETRQRPESFSSSDSRETRRHRPSGFASPPPSRFARQSPAVPGASVGTAMQGPRRGYAIGVISQVMSDHSALRAGVSYNSRRRVVQEVVSSAVSGGTWLAGARVGTGRAEEEPVKHRQRPSQHQPDSHRGRDRVQASRQAEQRARGSSSVRVPRQFRVVFLLWSATSLRRVQWLAQLPRVRFLYITRGLLFLLIPVCRCLLLRSRLPSL